MKVLDLTFPDPPPRIVEAVHLDPWPFKASFVDVARDVGWIDPEGVLQHGHFALGSACDVICRLSDGRTAITTLQGLSAYTNQGRS